MTLATLSEESAEGNKIISPYCSNLFYTWDGEHFIVTSSDSTQHGKDVLINSNIAASIVLETSTVGKIQGLQLKGRMYRPTDERLKSARHSYLKAFPFAVFMDLELWIIEPTFAKLTDNRLGFGKKLIWEK